MSSRETPQLLTITSFDNCITKLSGELVQNRIADQEILNIGCLVGENFFERVIQLIKPH